MSKYVEVALERARKALLDAPAGGSWETYKRELYGLLSLVKGGALPIESVEDMFRAVADVRRWDQKTIRRDIQRVLRKVSPRGSKERTVRVGRPVYVPPRRPEPLYTNPATIKTLIESARRVTDDPVATAWLEFHGIDPTTVEAHSLAGVLPEGVALPRTHGRFQDLGYRLIVVMYDALGRTKSLTLRRIFMADESLVRCGAPGDDLPNQVSFRKSELVFANPVARNILRGEDKPLSLALFVEGEKDYLRAATEWPNRAVVGIGSGSWSPKMASAFRGATDIVIATDNDPAGDRYAEEIAATYAGHESIWRWRPIIPTEDYADAGGFAGGEVTERMER